MVRAESTVSERQYTAGDATVTGLLAGIAAGIAMAAYLVLIGLLVGVGPTRMLARFDPPGAGAASPLAGTLIHLAMSAVYGLLFGVIYWLVGRRRLAGRAGGIVLGLAYGLILLLVAQALIATSAGAPLRQIGPIHFAVAHLIYGAVLGWLVGRK